MSDKVTSKVWRHSRAKGISLLVMLAIADAADDEGVAVVSTKAIAETCRIAQRSVFRSINELEESNSLEVERARGYNANTYRVLPCQ